MNPPYLDKSYYCHTSTGTMLYDPGKGTKKFEPWWALVLCDKGIMDYYAWFMTRKGILHQKGSSYGAHISFIKGYQPPNLDLWGVDPGIITFHYSNIIRMDNMQHAWLDCYSDQLNQLRANFGLPPKPNMSYHFTIARLSEWGPGYMTV